MTIYDWLDRLGGAVRREGDQYWCLCPVHNDHDPSLHVYVGEDGKTVMYCHACQANGKAIAESLGVPLRELGCDAISGEREERPRGAAKKRAPRKAADPPKPCRPLKVGAPWKDVYKVTNVYEYRARDGGVVVLKSRAEQYDESGTRIDKTFVMQHIGADGKWYWKAGIYTNLLYHLPDVLSGAEQGGRIYIAEGEKDVDNLRLIGLNATCGMTGAGKGKDLTGKWNDDHTKAFDGAGEVIVIADNDAAGERVAQWICKALKTRGQVGAVKLLRIAEHYPSLKAKGDFTDWGNDIITNGGSRSDVLARLNTMIDATPEWTPDNIRQFEAEPGQAPPPEKGSAAKAAEDDEYPSYEGSTLYCIKNGCLAVRNLRDGGAKILCDFLPKPKEIVTRDDGSAKRVDFVISATRPNGGSHVVLPDAIVEGTEKYRSMNWTMDAWGYWGNLKPIKDASKYVLDAINTAGQKKGIHRDVFEHTGMREVDGKMCYLYNGGAIGADNVSVEMPPDLRRYNLDDCGISPMDAAMAEMMLLDGFPARIVYPQLAQAYLAPLYSVMEAMQQPPSYVVMVIGESNAGKSTIAGYVLAHFGTFYNREFPANFEGTANGARDKLFWVKDCLMVVDDYRKGNRDSRMRNPHDAVADAIISAVADRSSRARLDEKKKLSSSRPCRGTCILTGEDTPKVSDSRQLRMYRIYVEPGEIYGEDVTVLEPYRQMAREGSFRQCMREYIKGLLARWEDIDGELEQRIDRANARMRKAISRREGRLLECATHLMVGVELMLDHLQACGVLDEADKTRRLTLAAKAIASNIEEQGRAIDENKPEEIWLETIRSLLATRSVTLMDEEYEGGDGFRAGMVGFKRPGEYLFVPAAIDEYVNERLRKSDLSLGATRTAILKKLAATGRVLRDPTTGALTPSMRIKGFKQTRVIRIPRWVIDDPDNPPKPEDLGFTPVEGEQLPMEFGEKNN